VAEGCVSGTLLSRLEHGWFDVGGISCVDKGHMLERLCVHRKTMRIK
jgi:hypothetical protein